MTISTKLQTIEDSLDNIKAALIAKGQTPTGDITTYAAAVDNLPPVPIVIPREVDANGVYQAPTTSFTFSLPSNATSLGNYALENAFYYCTGLTSVDLSSLTTISGSNAMGGDSTSRMGAFSNCTNLASVDLNNLTSITGYYALCNAFYKCISLTNINLNSLTEIRSSNALQNAFQGCTGLTSLNFPSLTTIRGNQALSRAFRDCTGLTSLNFPSLTSTSFGSYTNQFNGMLQGVTGCTVHFPSNLQSVIGSWSSVTSGFGGTNTTVSFDLPATT